MQSVQVMANQPNNLNLQLSSRPENINMVEDYVQRIKNTYQVSEEVGFNILLVLTEAVNNCIIHGNAANPSKNVEVNLKSQQKILCFTVSDEGTGFDPKILPDPTSPEHIDQPNGRGVFLMRELSDHMQYSNCGRKVELHFKIAKKS